MAKALPGNKKKFSNNLYSESYSGKNRDSGAGALQTPSTKINDLDNKATTQTELITEKPRNIDGVTGDKKLVKESDGKTYLYYKLESEWFKTELEKA
tara:strand:+ start:579 stop:869 length:291 start_codon:yes stop_codon:yes gene_type:complete